jgi:RNA polymerase sigma-70 factor, ECF subfamily
VAEDLTQDVFATLWVQAPSFDASRGTARAWAMTVTHRLALAAVRHQGAPRDAKTGPEPGAATVQQRFAIALAYFGGFTPPEVASAVGLPAPDVMTQIRDGLRRLGADALPPA